MLAAIFNYHYLLGRNFFSAGIFEAARLVAIVLTNPIAKFFGLKIHRDIAMYEKRIDAEMMRILERRLADHTPGEKKDICSQMTMTT